MLIYEESPAVSGTVELDHPAATDPQSNLPGLDWANLSPAGNLNLYHPDSFHCGLVTAETLFKSSVLSQFFPTPSVTDLSSSFKML